MEKIDFKTTQPIEKKLPANIEAEQALLGSILVNNDILDELSNIINSLKFLIRSIEKYMKLLKA